MSLPMPANVTVDIYQGANPGNPVPGGSPRLGGVAGYLKPDAYRGRHGTASWLRWTHVLIVAAGTDVRDAYNSQLDPGRNNSAADTVVVTDSNGNKVPYYVVFVEEAFRGTAYAQLRVYLDRFQPAQWPSDGV
jgi:hypothetical protein